MPSKLSRRKLSTYVADRLIEGDNNVIDELAALLVDEGRVREADLLRRDIEARLADKGQMMVKVETARPISSQTRQQIEQMFSGKTVHIVEHVNPELIGGLKISTPSQVLDASIATKLSALRTRKV